MKNKLKLITAALLIGTLGACSSKPQYKVAGSIDGANGETIYLHNFTSKEVIDSTTIQEGFFEFVNSVTVPEIAVLNISPNPPVTFVLENKPITVDIAEARATGTPYNDKLNALIQTITTNKDIINKLRKNIYGDNSLSVKEQGEAWMEELKTHITVIQETIRSAFDENLDNPVGLYALYQARFYFSVEEQKEMYNKAGESVKESLYGQQLNRTLTALDNTAVGKKFVDFEVADTNGKVQKLSDYVGNGKYVLVDFWASWCGPCRREIPNLIDIYNKYQGNAFDILGVAVWDEQENSEVAIEELGMPWNQILNTREVAMDLYGITSIPQIMLISPEGIIMARDLYDTKVNEAVESALAK